MRPAEALVELASGTLLMAPPTIEMLQLLTTFESVSAALEGIGRNKLKGAGHVLSVRMSPLVGVVLAPNSGLMTGPGTNSYVVGSGPCAVIDPAVDDKEYLAALEDMAGEVDLILITHRHPDHVGGAHALAGLTGAPVRAFGPLPAGGAEVTGPISDGEVLELAGTKLEALHTPGHASDHLSFLMRGAASLFAGDNILGEGTAVIAPPDGDMALFLSSLKRLKALHIDRIFPGHFRPLDGGHKVIRELIRHRLAREASVFQAVRDGAATPEAIVGVVYRETPAALHPIAMFSVLAHLEKLQTEGRVKKRGQRWSLCAAR
ncbi:MAG: MBL fold metallo-hydrolase [Actinomycetota bacterium]